MISARCADRVLCFDDHGGDDVAADATFRAELNDAGAAAIEVEWVNAVFGFGRKWQLRLLGSRAPLLCRRGRGPRALRRLDLR